MKQNLTIPNLLSFLRLVIVPFFVYYYWTQAYGVAFVLLILSALSDVLDGVIARAFHMTSPLGKVLDPVADKVTQAVVVVCLCVTEWILIPLAVLVCVREALMLIGSLVLLKKKKRPSEARWWGKLSTVLFYAVLLAALLKQIFPAYVPELLLIVLSIFSLTALIFAFVNYITIFLNIKNEPEEDETEETVD